MCRSTVCGHVWWDCNDMWLVLIISKVVSCNCIVIMMGSENWATLWSSMTKRHTEWFLFQTRQFDGHHIVYHKRQPRKRNIFKIPETSLSYSAASVLLRLLLFHYDILGRTASSRCGILRLLWDVWYTVVVRIPFLSQTERPKTIFFYQSGYMFKIQV